MLLGSQALVNDPYYNDAVLLLRGYDATSGQVFKDYSKYNHTITVNGNVAHSTTQKKYGNSSIYFDGGGNNYLFCSDSNDWDFSTNNFAFELWINFQSLPISGNSVYLMTQTNTIDNSWGYTLRNNSGTYQWNFFIYNSGYIQNIFVNDFNSSTLTTNKWIFASFVKNNNKVYFYRDGILCNSGGTNEVDALPNVAGNLYLFSNAGTQNVTASIEDLRITRRARDIIVPTQPFPNW